MGPVRWWEMYTPDLTTTQPERASIQSAAKRAAHAAFFGPFHCFHLVPDDDGADGRWLDLCHDPTGWGGCGGPGWGLAVEGGGWVPPGLGLGLGAGDFPPPLPLEWPGRPQGLPDRSGWDGGQTARGRVGPAGLGVGGGCPLERHRVDPRGSQVGWRRGEWEKGGLAPPGWFASRAGSNPWPLGAPSSHQRHLARSCANDDRPGGFNPAVAPNFLLTSSHTYTQHTHIPISRLHGASPRHGPQEAHRQLPAHPVTGHLYTSTPSSPSAGCCCASRRASAPTPGSGS